MRYYLPLIILLILAVTPYYIFNRYQTNSQIENLSKTMRLSSQQIIDAVNNAQNQELGDDESHDNEGG